MSGRVVRSTAIVVALVAFSTGLAGCADTPTSPSGTVPYSQTDLVVGTGSEATSGSVVTVEYTGWFYNPSAANQKGVQFDSSAGRSSLIFTLGTGQVITGWELGLPGMKVGGLRRLVIPPSLGYGSSRSGSIPPYATLVFEVELLDVQ